MLRKLKYSVTFPTTGRTLSADLSFVEGFTAITGPNESGKSMIFEMARYLLFGVAVLRGKSDDYKSLAVKGEFVIKGNIIEIERNTRGATMKRNDVTVATGTKPVNAKVIEELGFNLTVFDIACSINQGEVGKLGSMTPTARKAMVDSVLGLNALDLVAKWALEEAKALERQAEGMMERLTPPGAPPEKPDDWVPSSKLVGQVEERQKEAMELASVEGWLAAPQPAKPEKPTTKVDLPAANLISLAEKRGAARERVATLRAQVNALPETAPFTNALLDQVQAAWTAFHAYDAEARWAASNAPPAISVVDLTIMEVRWSDRDEWGHYENQLAEVERLRTALAGVEKIDCPECKASFALHADHAARLKEELIAAEALLEQPSMPKPDAPSMSSAQIDRMQKAWEDFQAERWDAFDAMAPVAKPDLAEREIDTYRRMIDQAVQRVALASELAVAEKKFADMADYEAMLADRRQYEANLETWQNQTRGYEAWLTDRTEKMTRKGQLDGAVERYQALAVELETSKQYEAARDRYDQVKDAYVEGVRVVGEIQTNAEEHRKVREVMAVLRGLIKQHVLPSLNTVASQLLRQMTGGQRNLVNVDDEFNVQVDNQDLDTLSGSGKACANLSLRIALGQVLTNRVISIMLADEIDDSMDDFRAEQTSSVLRMLEERVSQVLLVSHKQVDAPHHIRLGGFSED
jgi:DNA repair exonuclease SbcCD ATPase subunit